MPPPGKTLISSRRIQRRVTALARSIKSHYNSGPLTVVGLMNGSLFFLADLLRKLPSDTRIECWKVSSYRGRQSTGKIRGLEAVSGNYRNQPVLIVDDILDTGQTLHEVRLKLRRAGARDIRVCVLLSKKVRRTKPVCADWTGFDIADKFVIGYGLDLNHQYRQLPMIRVLDR